MPVLLRLAILGAAVTLMSSAAPAQITAPQVPTGARTATLEEQLVNRLKATRDDQRAYIKFVVKKVEDGKLEQRLVVAIERYAIRRKRQYPFPFFEMALRYESAKIGVALPPVKHFATTRATAPTPR